MGTLSVELNDFEAIYSAGLGRPSIPPERPLRALLLQTFYGIRSERQLMERLDADLLFRWFVGRGVDDAVWDPTTFGKNRDRLLAGDVAHKILAAVLPHPKLKRLLSSEHFSVDGTMIEAWASMKSVKPKDGPGEPPDSGATESATSMASAGPTTRTRVRPTRMPALPQGSGPRGAARLIGHAL